MNTEEMLVRINDGLRRRSRFETDRTYLGMSTIGRCPRVLYFNFVNGISPTMDAHRMAHVGYLFEGDAKERLTLDGIYQPARVAEIVAPFDSRFRGHPDGETADGDLAEIKSLSDEAYVRLIQTGRLKSDSYYQIQTYLLYGPWTNAVVFAINRDTFQHYVLSVSKDTRAGQKMEHKAKAVLAAIDARRPPACECGRCT